MYLYILYIIQIVEQQVVVSIGRIDRTKLNNNNNNNAILLITRVS